LAGEDLTRPEVYYPLKVMVCTQCWLVQVQETVDSETLFSPNYHYYSSYSRSWVEHARRYVEEMVSRFALGPGSTVVEVASNDGYLLQFVGPHGIACYGIEPTRSTATAASERGIETIEAFFGERLARELASAGRGADLMAANNVLAHVPDINDFVSGFAELLNDDGVATFEFPHLVKLVEHSQFDTIYHEHYSYLSLTVVERIFARNGLAVFDVDELSTHGGSLRVFAQRADTGRREQTGALKSMLERERRLGVETPEYYADFQVRTDDIRFQFLEFLVKARRDRRNVAGYGAAAKGNTLMNYCGIRRDLVGFVVDRNPHKQGHYLPGSRIPIVDESRIHEQRPDYIVILPWNLRDEIAAQLSYIQEWGGRMVTAVPGLDVFGPI